MFISVWQATESCCKTKEIASGNERFNAIGVALFRIKLSLIQVYIDINHTMKRAYQRRMCCDFDSPGLPNDSVGYPGLTYGVWETTP